MWLSSKSSGKASPPTDITLPPAQVLPQVTKTCARTHTHSQVLTLVTRLRRVAGPRRSISTVVRYFLCCSPAQRHLCSLPARSPPAYPDFTPISRGDPTLGASLQQRLGLANPHSWPDECLASTQGRLITAACSLPPQQRSLLFLAALIISIISYLLGLCARRDPLSQAARASAGAQQRNPPLCPTHI